MDRLGKYEVRSVLGRGAMGTVYEGWDPVISRRVAIKTIIKTAGRPDRRDSEEQEVLQRFHQEAQATGRLQHPNIVGVFDYAETDKLAYIVMEFVDGRTLQSLTDAGRRLERATIGRLMDGLLTGLAYSHAQGIIHRDIKPANIIVTASGQVKIADFGIARIESSTMTQDGSVMGTPAYMSPEQVRGLPVDGRTDIYAAGVILFQLLTGHRPFEGGMAAIMHAVLTAPVPRPSSLDSAISPTLEAVMLRAIARAPEDRFPDAESFAHALKSALPAGAPAVPRRRVALPFLAVAALLALAGGGAFWAFSDLGGSPARVPSPVLHELPDPPRPDPAPALPLAAPSPEAMRRSIAAAVQSAPCSFLQGRDAPDGLPAVVTGVAGAGTDLAALRDAVVRAVPGRDAVWDVTEVSDGYCSLLDLLQPYAGAYNGPGRPAVTFGPTPGQASRARGSKLPLLQTGELIQPKVLLPGEPTYLQLDYVSIDGSVLHMHTSRPGTPFSAFNAIQFGEPRPPVFFGWGVASPYGTDLVVAVGTSAPLFRAGQVLPANLDAYLKELRTGFAAVTQGGGRLMVGVAPLQTEAKP